MADGTICIPSNDQRLENLESFIKDAKVNWAIVASGVELGDIESHIQKRSQFGTSAVVEVIDLLDGLMQQTLVAFQGPLQHDHLIHGVINENHLSDKLQHKTQSLVHEAIELAAAGRDHGFAITVADIFLHPRLEDQALLLKSSYGSDFFD